MWVWAAFGRFLRGSWASPSPKVKHVGNHKGIAPNMLRPPQNLKIEEIFTELQASNLKQSLRTLFELKN